MHGEKPYVCYKCKAFVDSDYFPVSLGVFLLNTLVKVSDIFNIQVGVGVGGKFKLENTSLAQYPYLNLKLPI